MPDRRRSGWSLGPRSGRDAARRRSRPPQRYRRSCRTIPSEPDSRRPGSARPETERTGGSGRRERHVPRASPVPDAESVDSEHAVGSEPCATSSLRLHLERVAPAFRRHSIPPRISSPPAESVTGPAELSCDRRPNWNNEVRSSILDCGSPIHVRRIYRGAGILKKGPGPDRTGSERIRHACDGGSVQDVGGAARPSLGTGMIPWNHRFRNRWIGCWCGHARIAGRR
jgi:hypothetical protein